MGVWKFNALNVGSLLNINNDISSQFHSG